MNDDKGCREFQLSGIGIGIIAISGTTRDNFDGKKVVHLEYEAYESMAENEIQKIVQEMRQQWTVEHIAIHHRLGFVKLLKNNQILL